MTSSTVQVKVVTIIEGTRFESQVYNMRKAVQVVDALCDLNKPPQVFVCVGNGTFQEVDLSDFV